MYTCHRMDTLEKNLDIEIRITSLAGNGSGVGRFGGVVVFVPFSAPGDLVKARIVKVADAHAFGKLIDVIEPADCRTHNDCHSFTKCGGCVYRHINYSKELAIKRDAVQDAMLRIGKIDAMVNCAVASPVIDFYRNKAQLPVSFAGEGLGIGFYARRSHRVVPFEDGCRLQPGDMTEVAEFCCVCLAELGVKAYEESTGQGLLRHLILRKSGDGSLMLALVLNGAGFLQEEAFCEAVSLRFEQVKTVIVNRNQRNTNVILGEKNRTLLGSGFITDRLAGIDFRLSLPSFFQINRCAAELLYRKIREYADPGKDDTLLDLYCGVGSIGLSMAKDVKRLIGVEVVKTAVDDAKYNALRAGASNAVFIESDAKTAAAGLTESVDIAVVDPPRKGCDPETLISIKRIAPKRIVMISCNPATLARDLSTLSGFGYSVREITPVDMFPRTAHVECAALLQR
ncbi:MAG: 23S rRNA (uracil(1939)-C(5))-methyltransferase RlmD [Oscillospiraceae bacterium]|nr:23S rRNA (uracil(1939)-C(5))-methyltransferase RlmD [Oscillospiraceae bacterium]